jgi:hypothetical protein
MQWICLKSEVFLEKDFLKNTDLQGSERCLKKLKGIKKVVLKFD